MTEPKPALAPSDILVEKTDELSTKTLGLSKSVAETIGKRIRALDALREREGITGDPVRMQAIVDRLFEAADTLIYLAEDMRAAQSRAERTVQERQLVDQAATAADNEPRFDRDEAELLAMLESMEGEPVSLEYLLENGFGTSISSDRTVRKKSLQRCLRSLAEHPLLHAHGKVLIKEGQTRGTKYSVQAIEGTPHQAQAPLEQNPAPGDSAAGDDKSPKHPSEPKLTAPEPTTSATTTELKRKNPLEGIVESTIDTILRMDEKRPYVCIQDIVRIGFAGKRLEPEVFREVRELVSSDPRITHIANGEYRIIGRDLSEEWVDHRALRIAADGFIDNMVKWGSTQEDTLNLIRAAGRSGMWLTKDERNVLMSIARRDYRVVTVDENKLVIDATRTKERDPNRHLRGMSPLELDKTMARLGLKNTAPFRRRR